MFDFRGKTFCPNEHDPGVVMAVQTSPEPH